MPAGRCSGCGRTDSLRKVRLHVVECTDYIELFRQEPARALDPHAEYVRYRREHGSPEARAVQRGHRLEVRFAEINRHQAASTSRWATPPDILE